MGYSQRQIDLIEAICHPAKKHVVASGPVRAGKSHAALNGWAHWCRQWRGVDLGLVAASDSRLKATTLEIEELAARTGTHWKMRDRHIEWGYNRIWRWVSSHSKSFAQIRGHTFASTLVDEATKVQPECVREINNRSSLTPPKIIYSTNPEGPTHPFKLGVIDPIVAGERPGEYVEFAITDNPSLTADIIDDIRRGLPEGPIRQRDFHGKWAEAGGAMFPSCGEWVRNPPKGEPPIRCWISGDSAEVGVFHYLLIGEWPGQKYWVLDEYRWDGRTQGIYPKAHHAARVASLGGSAPSPVVEWLSDPADSVMIDTLRKTVKEQGLPGVVLSPEQQPKPKDLEAVRAVNIAGNNKRLHIAGRCGHLLDELRSSIYDEKKLALGVEASTDGDDHGIDALKYWVWYTAMWRGLAWV